VKIKSVEANNRRKAFRLVTTAGAYDFPYAKLEARPTAADRVVEVFPDPEAGYEAFTFRLASGAEDSVHLDAVLEYHNDPTILNQLLLHRLTVEAGKALVESGLSKRELIRRLRTSAAQLYRLLDPTYYDKSIDQMLSLLRVLGRDVDLVIHPGRGGAKKLAG
jgi:hypothetical protein